ncbi:probable 2-oxoglutarate-dependent dioxygenase AOP1 [Vicia villosa]|uniref:probable 2-oxoglutarate-dependent dioxygenase AOP1 n=1 Tax=Vicia villosa TaxID=3911 RepID=UPI00273B29E1|nr:probable 2-oxoglutarate-dependent dioxygenase AOP1 [Vicia villosa]
MGTESKSQTIPIIDFSDQTMKPGTDTWLSASNVVRTSLENFGCFVANYDRVGKELCNSVVLQIEELFSLPLETKVQKTSNTDRPFHGYIGQVPWLPLYESLAIIDPLTMLGCQKSAQIMWSQGNDRFCEIMNEYSKLLGELDHIAKRMVFESYGVDMKICESLIESSNYLIRVMKYRRPDIDENDLGLQPHSDLTIVSVVHQLNNLNGLEIKMKNGDWVGVDASPSSFVVMAGDAFKVWSNGRIRSCEHRVIMNAKKTRYSTGLFSFGGKMMEIPEEFVNEEHPLRYKPTFDHYDYLRFYEKEKINETSSRIEAYFGIDLKPNTI